MRSTTVLTNLQRGNIEAKIKTKIELTFFERCAQGLREELREFKKMTTILISFIRRNIRRRHREPRGFERSWWKRIYGFTLGCFLWTIENFKFALRSRCKFWCTCEELCDTTSLSCKLWTSRSYQTTFNKRSKCFKNGHQWVSWRSEIENPTWKLNMFSLLCLVFRTMKEHSIALCCGQ